MPRRPRESGDYGDFGVAPVLPRSRSHCYDLGLPAKTTSVARIFFWTWDEPGHVNPALALAKRLVLRGHSIGFLGGEGTAGMIEPHGFAVRDPAFDAYAGAQSPHCAMTDVVEMIRGLRADLILCDAIRTFEVVVVLKAGTRSAIYSTSLPFWSDSLGPPVYTAIPEPRSWYGRMRVVASWKRNALRQWRQRRRFMKELPGYRHVNDFLQRAQAELGIRTHDIDWNTFTGIPLPYFRHVPTLVMCPKALDFARTDDQRLHWIEPCILRERLSMPLPHEIDPHKPLLFVSLGTQVHRVSWAERWFATVCDVITRRRDWQGVLAVGPVLAPRFAGRAIPGRLAVMATAPQHLILDKAAVAVIHGGLNSVKECVTAGVPMAIFPTGRDQPGNAVRVQTRGLGLVGSAHNLTADGLDNMLRTLMTDSTVRAKIAAMRQEFQRVEQEDAGVAVVESLLPVDRSAGARADRLS